MSLLKAFLVGVFLGAGSAVVSADSGHGDCSHEDGECGNHCQPVLAVEVAVRDQMVAATVCEATLRFSCGEESSPFLFGVISMAFIPLESSGETLTTVHHVKPGIVDGYGGERSFNVLTPTAPGRYRLVVEVKTDEFTLEEVLFRDQSLASEKWWHGRDSRSFKVVVTAK